MKGKSRDSSGMLQCVMDNFNISHHSFKMLGYIKLLGTHLQHFRRAVTVSDLTRLNLFVTTDYFSKMYEYENSVGT
jgi:hypothetical protein